jgi:aryl-alcohol dehydrogenase-like predicted oxidoreductase
MRYRTFGRHTGLLCSEIALGVSLFGHTGYGATSEDAREILDAFIEAGGNFVDTSSRYRFGESEQMLGELAAGRRDGLIIATKYCRGDARTPQLTTVGANRKAMVQSVERSLKRLGTDRIDLLYVHMDDHVTPIEEILRGFDDLASAGKIIYGGFSNYPAWRLAYGVALTEARGWLPISGIQIEYSAIQRAPERELLPMADALGIGVVCWSPLAGGLLTGKYRQGATGRATEYREAMPQRDEGQAAATITEVLAVAEECGVTASQVALAWLASKGLTPLIGPRTPAQLKDNLGSLVLRLDDKNVARIDNAGAIAVGYPYDLTTSPGQRAINTAGMHEFIDMPTRQVV